MKASKGLMVAVAVLFILGLGACGSSKYSDMEEVMNAQAEAMEDYVGSMESAENAQDVVASMNGFTTAMKDLIPKMKEIRSKYPEMANPQELPEALKDKAEKMQNLGGKLQQAMMKSMQYMQDPEVQKAMEEQGKIMVEMAQE